MNEPTIANVIQTTCEMCGVTYTEFRVNKTTARAARAFRVFAMAAYHFGHTRSQIATASGRVISTVKVARVIGWQDHNTARLAQRVIDLFTPTEDVPLERESRGGWASSYPSGIEISAATAMDPAWAAWLKEPSPARRHTNTEASDARQPNRQDERGERPQGELGGERQQGRPGANPAAAA